MENSLIYVAIIIIVIILIIWIFAPKQVEPFVSNPNVTGINSVTMDHLVSTVREALYQIHESVLAIRSQISQYAGQTVPSTLQNFINQLLTDINMQVDSINSQIQSLRPNMSAAQVQELVQILMPINMDLKLLNDTIANITQQRAKYLVIIPTPILPPITPAPACPTIPPQPAPVPPQPAPLPRPPTPAPIPSPSQPPLPYCPTDPTEASVALIVPIAKITDPSTKHHPSVRAATSVVPHAHRHLLFNTQNPNIYDMNNPYA